MKTKLVTMDAVAGAGNSAAIVVIPPKVIRAKNTFHPSMFIVLFRSGEGAKHCAFVIQRNVAFTDEARLMPIL